MREWVHERDNYTRIQLLMKYFASRRYIFVIEAELLTIEVANKVEFWVVVGRSFGDILCQSLFILEIILLTMNILNNR